MYVGQNGRQTQAVSVDQVVVLAVEFILHAAPVTCRAVSLHVRGVAEVVSIEESASRDLRYRNVAETAGGLRAAIGDVALRALLVEPSSGLGAAGEIEPPVAQDLRIASQRGMQA